MAKGYAEKLDELLDIMKGADIEAKTQALEVFKMGGPAAEEYLLSLEWTLEQIKEFKEDQGAFRTAINFWSW